MQPNPVDELGAAIEAEREAWRAVRGHLPGTPDHDPRLWEAWRAAMRRCEEARKVLARQRRQAAPPRREE